MTRKNLVVAYLVGVWLGVESPARAAIVDTLGTFEDRPGLSTILQAGFSARGGNTEVLELATAGRIQWHEGRHRARLMAAYSRQTNNAEEIAEDALAHFRHNFLLGRGIHSLAFLQIQRNPFQRLRSRTLLGLGTRADFLNGERGSASLGAAHMVEREELEDVMGSQTHQRLSTFLVADVRLTETSTLVATMYAQPRWEDWNDLRAIGSAALRVKLTDRLELEVGASFQHDSRPPDGVKESDWQTQTGLRFQI